MADKRANNTGERTRGAKKLRGRDRLGTGAQLLATAGGAGAGASAAGIAASAAGASTLLGSTTLGGLLGGVFVTTTPVGWIVGMAAAGAAAGYGITWLARSAGEQDRVRRQLARKLAKGRDVNIGKEQVERLSTMLRDKVASGTITLEKAGQVVGLVASGRLDAGVAIERLKALPPATPVDHA